MSGDYSNSPDYFNQLNGTFRVSAEVLQNNIVQMYNSDNIMDAMTRNGARSDSHGRSNFGNQGRPWMSGGYRGQYGAGPPSRYFTGSRFEPPWTPPSTCFPPPPPPPPPQPLVPNVPNPELWVEVKSDRGKPYYYHSRTRETTWTRPAESPMCRVVTHMLIEDIATSAIPERQDSPRYEEADTQWNPPVVATPMPDFAQPPPWNGHERTSSPAYNIASSEQMPQYTEPPVWNRLEETSTPAYNIASSEQMPQYTEPPVWNRLEGGISGDNADYTQSFSQTIPATANGYPCTPNHQWSGDGPWVGWGSVESSQPSVPIMQASLPQAMISQLETHTSPPQAPELPPVYCDNRPPQPKAQPYQPAWPNQRPRVAKPAIQPTVPPTTENKLAGVTKGKITLERSVMICRNIRPKKAKTKISNELKALAEEWTTHKSPDGHSYYYHAKEKKSVWVKPPPLREYDELKAKIAREEAEEERLNKNSKIVDVIDLEDTTDGINEESLAQREKERLDFVSFYETLQKEEKEREVKEREEKERQEREIAEQERKIREDKEREDKEREEKLKKEQEEKEKQEKIRLEIERQEKERQEKERQEKERQERERQEKERQEKERQEKERQEKERQEKEREEKERQEKQEKEKARKEKKRKKKEELTKEDWNKPFMNLPVPGTPWLIVWTVSGGRFFFNSAASHAVWIRPSELAARRDVDLMVARPPPAVVRAKEKYVAAMAAKEAGKPQEETESNGEEVEAIDKPVDAKKRRNYSTEDVITDAYADTPLVEKQQIFRQMLIDNKVSALSTWEKELHKIVFDSRYKLLTNDQRKLVFERFVQEKGPEEKKEKEMAFKLMLEEEILLPNFSYQEFVSKYGDDARFTAVDNLWSQTLFEDHTAELRRKSTRSEKAKQDFIAMLKENNIDRHARWADVGKRLEADARCKVVVSNTVREEYFKEYCKIVKEERKKDRASTSIKKNLKKAVGKKSKRNEKADNGESKQPTPPREQWADIIGVPDAEKQRRDKNKSAKSHTKTSASDEDHIAATSSRPSLKRCSVTLKKCVVPKCGEDENVERTKESTDKKKVNSNSVNGKKVKKNKKSRDDSVDSDSSEDLQKIADRVKAKSPPKNSTSDKKTTEEGQVELMKTKMKDKDLPLIKRRISVLPTDSPELDVSHKCLRSSTVESSPIADQNDSAPVSSFLFTIKKTSTGRTTGKRKKNCTKD